MYYKQQTSGVKKKIEIFKLKQQINRSFKD